MNRPASPYPHSSMIMHSPRKSVSFSHTLPDVHLIPLDSASWAEGEHADEPTQYEVDHAADLARSSLALATALDEEEAVGVEVWVHDSPNSARTACRLSYESMERPASLLHTVRKSHAPDCNSPTSRQALPTRAYTTREDFPQRVDSHHDCEPRPRLQRAATTHQFGDFLDDRKMHHKGERISDRRASLHPFEHLATMAFRKTKKEAVKVAALLEEKLKERKAKR
jgi:hypothetical protein